MTNLEAYRPSVPEREVQLGRLKVRLGPVRVVMREAMFPTMARYADGSIVLAATVVEGKGPIRAIRSEDGGVTWRRFTPNVAAAAGSDRVHMDNASAFGAGTNPIQLNDGTVLTVSVYTTPIPSEPGWYQTTRWESDDAWRTVRGPLIDGRLFLPPETFSPDKVQWFHGNIIELPDGRLLAAMQGVEYSEHPFFPFQVYLSESDDRGRTWRYVSTPMTLDAIAGAEAFKASGWKLHGPCEPNLLHVGDGRLACVARTVNDDAQPLVGPVSDSFHDLSFEVASEGIPPGMVDVPADRYVRPGPPSAPLIIAFSEDTGRTWTKPVQMSQARGCFPRMAKSKNLCAMVYGGLAYPRWGNCIAFSTDGGKTWTEEINFGPYLTTGYCDIVVTNPGRFLCAFDCTPPQPWANHSAHWVGVLDIDVG